MEEKLVAYGGQAVIEGVMMRGKRTCTVAVRAPNGSIIIKNESLGKVYQSHISKIPFLRGLILLWDSLGLGLSALTYSANLQTGEDEKITGPSLALTIGLSFLFAVGIFFLVPAGIGWLTENFLHWNAWWSNLAEGVIRLVFLIGYLWIIGFSADIARVFGYHGAEHKTINAYEAGVELTPETVSEFSVEHPRCGTAFLLTLAVLSLFFFTLMGQLPLEWRLISRVLMLPVLAGIAYEFIRWTSAHLASRIVRLIARPNLALQHLTTREPEIKMLEVAIAAFTEIQKAEQESIN
jgi:uncharacterized protein YqhQ